MQKLQRDMVTVTFSFNQNYIKYAKVLVNSIKANSPNVNIVARAVNVNLQDLTDAWCEGVTFILDTSPYSNKKDKIKSLADNHTSFWQGKIPKRSLLYSDEISYTCHSRFINILTLLENGIDNIFCVDVDFIIRKDLSSLLNLKKDIHIMHKMVDNKKTFTDEDAIFIKNTPKSKKFIKAVYNYISTNLNFWDADTKALSDAYETNNSVSLHQLNIKYKDFNLEESSIAWSGDGGSKFTSKFLLESMLYS